MGQLTAPEVVDLFKSVYGSGHDLLPQNYLLEKDIPFDQKQKVGEKYVESVILSNENGITLGGNGYDAFNINPAVAGAVKQIEVQPYSSVLSSIIPWSVISRSAGAGDKEAQKKAFFSATKHIVKNNLKSHSKFMEIFRWYGQSSKKLGSVSYATATYRGVAFTNGGGALEHNGTSVTYTAGVNTTSNHILMAPGDWASGIWIGSEGMAIEQIASATGLVVASGKVISVDSLNGSIAVDFTPVAATAANSHYIGISGQAGLKEMVGSHKILSTVGTLFGLDNIPYPLFQGNTYNVNGALLTLQILELAVANAVNRGGLDGDIRVYVNPRTLAKMINTEAGRREYDGSYDVEEGKNGFKAIKFYGQNGTIDIIAHRFVMEGDAFGMCLPEWSRSGSAEVSFQVPGINKDIIFPLENQAGYAFRSFSDQYLFCYQPSKSIYFYGINDEAAS